MNLRRFFNLAYYSIGVPLILASPLAPFPAATFTTAIGQQPRSDESLPLKSVLVGEIETLPIPSQHQIQHQKQNLTVPTANSASTHPTRNRPDATAPGPNSVANPDSVASSDSAANPIDGEPELNRLLTEMVLKHLPHQFSEDKDWGKQEHKHVGVRLKRDGFRIRADREQKMVNHGTWKRVDVSLVNPQQQFTVEVKNMRQTDQDGLLFDVHFAADLKIDARQSKWARGIQLYSISADGKAKVRMIVSVELATIMDITKFPPDLIFKPKATDAKLIIDEFRIDRISKIGGELAQQASAMARSALEKRLSREEQKLVKKINGELTENAAKLRLSVSDAMSTKWSAAAKGLMPKDVQEAME